MRYLALLFLLSACANHTAEDHAKCLDLGFKKGTEGYGNCRLQLEAMRSQRKAIIGGALISRPVTPVYIPPPVINGRVN